MDKIAKLPKARGKLVCRLRGQQCHDGRLGSEIYDYDILMASKRARELLRQMPIEINNVHWLTGEDQVSPEKRAQTIKVSRFVLGKFGSNPRSAFEVMSSINREWL